MTFPFVEDLSRITQREYVIPTSSGSAAIICALNTLGIPPDSDVIIPSICCPAVLFAINLAGFHPIISDVNRDDFCMGVDEIKEVITNKTRVIIAVHAYGRYCPIDEIESFAKDKDLFLIEDACLGLGGMYHGMPFGGFGDVSIFSFGYDKIIDVGGGGALVTNNYNLYVSCQDFVRGNSFFTFSENQTLASNLKLELNTLEEKLEKRNANAYICHQFLDADKVFKPSYSEDLIYWRYAALYKGDRPLLLNKAKEHGVIITTHYKGLHQLRTGVQLTNAEEISNQIINLFIRPETNVSEIEKTIAIINES